MMRVALLLAVIFTTSCASTVNLRERCAELGFEWDGGKCWLVAPRVVAEPITRV